MHLFIPSFIRLFVSGKIILRRAYNEPEIFLKLVGQDRAWKFRPMQGSSSYGLLKVSYIVHCVQIEVAKKNLIRLSMT